MTLLRSLLLCALLQVGAVACGETCNTSRADAPVADLPTSATEGVAVIIGLRSDDCTCGSIELVCTPVIGDHVVDLEVDVTACADPDVRCVRCIPGAGRCDLGKLAVGEWQIRVRGAPTGTVVVDPV